MKKKVFTIFILVMCSTVSFSQSWYRIENLGDNFPLSISIYSLVSNSNVVLVGSDYGIFRSEDDGANWTNPLPDYHLVSGMAICNNGYLFASVAQPSDSGVFRSVDGGVSWSANNTSLTDKLFYSIAVNSNDQVFAGSHGCVYRTSDYGNTWTALSSGLDTGYVNALAINAAGDIFAGIGGSVYKSSDNGATWSSLVSWQSHNVSISKLAVNSDGVLFACSKSLSFVFSEGIGIMRSDDNGNTWTKTSFPDSSNWSILLKPYGEMYACSEDVYHSINDGNTWENLSDMGSGLPSYRVEAITMSSNKYLFAGLCCGAGLYRTTNPFIGIEENSDNGNKINMKSFPNPVSSKITIEYSLPEESTVQFKIFDAQGKEIYFKQQEKLNAGAHSNVLDITDFSDGLYFFILKTTNSQILQKIQIVK